VRECLRLRPASTAHRTVTCSPMSAGSRGRGSGSRTFTQISWCLQLFTLKIRNNFGRNRKTRNGVLDITLIVLKSWVVLRVLYWRN
jgi:hypothetical protein